MALLRHCDSCGIVLNAGDPIFVLQMEQMEVEDKFLIFALALPPRVKEWKGRKEFCIDCAQHIIENLKIGVVKDD